MDGGGGTGVWVGVQRGSFGGSGGAGVRGSSGTRLCARGGLGFGACTGRRGCSGGQGGGAGLCGGVRRVGCVGDSPRGSVVGRTCDRGGVGGRVERARHEVLRNSAWRCAGCLRNSKNATAFVKTVHELQPLFPEYK